MSPTLLERLDTAERNLSRLDAELADIRRQLFVQQRGEQPAPEQPPAAVVPPRPPVPAVRAPDPSPLRLRDRSARSGHPGRRSTGTSSSAPGRSRSRAVS